MWDDLLLEMSRNESVNMRYALLLIANALAEREIDAHPLSQAEPGAIHDRLEGKEIHWKRV